MTVLYRKRRAERSEVRKVEVTGQLEDAVSQNVERGH